MTFEDKVIEKTIYFVKSKLHNQETGHDWYHVERVWQNAIQIGLEENADMFVVQLASLLHDIADWKFHSGDESVGPKVAHDWLESLGVNDKIIKHVCEIIKTMPFKGAKTSSIMSTIEGKIVQDADRLDAIGAIGIARAFSYGAYNAQEIYNPDIKPVLHSTFHEYKHTKTTTINHFYEKLFFLKERMNTSTARKIADERHKFMVDFIKTLQKECKIEFLPQPEKYLHYIK
ncbi:phosphohydrolase [Bacillus mycoides]|uniref:HD domain-containing protein n=1 Tax=Bacillus mycoides TaxID=1405 RepID=UPI001E44166C|nr:HD domain-containing protein [Bacillus mycoides]MCD4646984.1 phosphohydrolase [Bacillus mycoides]